MRTKLLVILGVMTLGLIVGPTALAADSTPLDLTVLSQTSTTITLGWTPPAEVNSYIFYVGGERVSNSLNPAKNSVKFAKAACNGTPDCYVVVWNKEGGRGGHTKAVACNNKKDDDADGKIDYPADPGCTSATDTDETDTVTPPPNPACSDGLDNDADGKIDYPTDPGCSSATDTDETDTVTPPPTTITPSQFASLATSGATIENVTVTGDVIVRNPNVTLRNVTIQGSIEFYNLADGCKMLSSRALDLFIWGADNLLVDGNTFDGGNRTNGGKMWDMSGDYPQNVTITNNTFKNQNSTATDPSQHTQAMFVGYSDGVLISGNTFINNGSTADIFFSWYTETNPSSSRTYPRNVCVKGNSFSDPNNLHYFAINFRAEITTVANIVTDPNEPGFSTTSPEFNGTC